MCKRQRRVAAGGPDLSYHRVDLPPTCADDPGAVDPVSVLRWVLGVLAVAAVLGLGYVLGRGLLP